MSEFTDTSFERVEAAKLASPCSSAVGGTPDSKPFGKREWSVVAIAVAQAVLWMLVFWPEEFTGKYAGTFYVPGLHPYGHLTGLLPALPGIGLALVEIAGFGSAIAVLGKRARLDRVTIPLLAACLVMSVFPAVFGNGMLRCLNCLVLWVVGTYTLFLVGAMEQRCAVCARGLVRALGLFFSSLFTYMLEPVRQGREAVRLRRSQRKAVRSEQRNAQVQALGSVGLGIAAAAALLTVVLPLLVSADAVFGSVFSAMLESLERVLSNVLTPGEATVRVLFVLAVGPVLFGLLWGFTCVKPEERLDASEACARRPPAALTVAVALAALDGVYLAFVGVQFVYLFGGVESAAMNGGYAEYARSGFFQLVAVAALNIAVGLVAVRAVNDGESRSDAMTGHVVRVLVCVLVATSFVILASAFLRMVLYVSVYGLSILRCLTLFGMAFSAVLLVALVAKLVRPHLNYFAVFLYAGVALWIAFNVANIDARIADYNVDRYLSGELVEFDCTYCFSLSPDAKPAMERLAAARPDDEMVEIWFHDVESSSALPWHMQCLAYLVNR